MVNFDQHIEALKQKDEETFTLVYEETKNLVYSMILSIISDRDLCQDVMQDVYLTMLEKINHYKIGSNFRAWLLVIARNKAIDYYRKRKRELLIDPDTMENLGYISPQGEHSAIVSEILNNLNQNERSIFLLYVIQGLKHREIAKILDLPLGTVLWHYQNARKKIKRMEGKE
jgi:RNA polymerase sigma-70 factor (ECF subfamily)